MSKYGEFTSGSDPIDIMIFQDDRLGATQISTNNLIRTYPIGSPQGYNAA